MRSFFETFFRHFFGSLFEGPRSGDGPPGGTPFSQNLTQLKSFSEQVRCENVRVAHTRVYIWASEGAFEDFGVEKALLGRGSVSEHVRSQIFFIFRCRFGTPFGPPF